MRRTIYLSLGMLHKVDTNPFIAKMIETAIKNNPNFKFTPEIMKECFAVSAQFNQGNISPEIFKDKLLTLLGGLTIADSDFWHDWNSIVKVNMTETDAQLAELKEFCAKNKCRLVFTSDINKMHLNTLSILYNAGDHKIAPRPNIRPSYMQIDGTFPLLATCDYHLDRLGIIKRAVSMNMNDGDREIKFYRKTPYTDVVLGDPSNIKNPLHRIAEEAKIDSIRTWCAEHDVNVVMHKNDSSLMTTLNFLVTPLAERDEDLNLSSLFCGR